MGVPVAALEGSCCAHVRISRMADWHGSDKRHEQGCEAEGDEANHLDADGNGRCF